MKGRGLFTYVQFVWIKRIRQIEYPVAQAQSLHSKMEADDRTCKR